MKKIDLIRKLWHDGNKLAALSIASKFHDKSAETRAFKQAASARLSPNFYKQMGKDPHKIVDSALATLQRKFKLG